MKFKLLFLFMLALSASVSHAFNFDSACAELKAIKTSTTGNDCRYATDEFNVSIHRVDDGYAFGQLYVYEGKLSDKVFSQIRKLAAVMEVEISNDFYKAIPETRPGQRLGMLYKDRYVFWRAAFEKGEINYSGLVIYPMRESKESYSVRCRPAGCGHDSTTTWLGPAVDEKTQNVFKK